jgi:Dehydratase medium subunit
MPADLQAYWWGTVADNITRRGSQPQRPVIMVFTGGVVSSAREVLAGIEEEGVPYTAQSAADAHSHEAAADLAIRAAAQSPLQVGVGVGASGDACVCHARLAHPVFEVAAGVVGAAMRTLGHNAARIVAGLPLKPLADGNIGGIQGHVGLDSAGITDDTAH